jgi:putative oxygen-independent coproporphyrinogen III oxidase
LPSQLPQGDPAPTDGALPASVLSGAESRTLSAYVHVPFCRVRCGYCDFNTYTATELRGSSQATYSRDLSREIALSRAVVERAQLPARPLSSVFFGGGTPTLLPVDELAGTLGELRSTFGLAPGAEVTTEANPDSVDQQYLERLVRAGFTRVSFGVQSVVPHVLATLDRTHDTERVSDVVRWAQQAGLEVSVDLIYATPGESLEDWRASAEFAASLGTGHISAYSLIVEEGTALARRIGSGELPEPDDDLAADMYDLADDVFSAAGLEWYEVSNWAASDQQQSVHNMAYWTGQDWWGYGPGAHSHVGGVRFWNAKHPAAYASRLSEGLSPSVGRETPDADSTALENILLRTRLRAGLSVEFVPADAVAELVERGLLNAEAAHHGRVELTRNGRLLADAVVRRLTDG